MLARRAIREEGRDDVLSGEQLELQASMGDLLTDHSPESRVREVITEGAAFDTALWEQLSKLGVPGLAVPEALGGQGGTLTDLCVALVEAGAALACVPLLTTTSAIATLQAAGATELIGPLATGEQVWTLATAERRAGWNPHQIATEAGRQDGNWVLRGEKSYVPHATAAYGLVVTARTDHGPGLFAVTADAPGLTIGAARSLDATRPLGKVTFEDAPARELAVGTAAGAAFASATDSIAVLLAADASGVARRCLDMAVEYAKTRHQFGRAIGSFQSIKHACADLAVAGEGALSLTWDAASTVDSEAADASIAAATAKAYCCDAAVRCAEQNIQIHGGVGFTWEHPAHLYLRRAKGDELLFGSPEEHRDRVARAMAAAT
jgi:alkylation response protein AidB-like acyl-CoA dehydrogenase